MIVLIISLNEDRTTIEAEVYIDILARICSRSTAFSGIIINIK